MPKLVSQGQSRTEGTSIAQDWTRDGYKRDRNHSTLRAEAIAPSNRFAALII